MGSPLHVLWRRLLESKFVHNYEHFLLRVFGKYTERSLFCALYDKPGYEMLFWH